jgi:hypothetical protein
VNKEVETMGIKIVKQFALLGTYDFVSLVEAPDNETVMKMSVEIGTKQDPRDGEPGRIDSQTTRVVGEDANRVTRRFPCETSRRTSNRNRTLRGFGLGNRRNGGSTDDAARKRLRFGQSPVSRKALRSEWIRQLS